jgi:indole-3-glycerol phosphate synthase
MTESFLDRILTQKKVQLEQAKKIFPLTEEMVKKSLSSAQFPPRSFLHALDRPDRLNIIAEIKRASPSKGMLRELIDPVEIGLDYDSYGAAAISVLTEENYFLGSLQDLKYVTQNVSIPTLRKDFLFDPYQVYEAALQGASAVLLIVAILSEEELRGLLEITHRLEMNALVEVHNDPELEIAVSVGAKIIGVNNRDLRTFKVDLQTSFQLASRAPDSIVLVSESGITTPDDIRLLREAGFDAFLIGELLMRSPHPGKALRELIIRSLN